jgi:hypothetical protein
MKFFPRNCWASLCFRASRTRSDKLMYNLKHLFPFLNDMWALKRLFSIYSSEYWFFFRNLESFFGFLQGRSFCFKLMDPWVLKLGARNWITFKLNFYFDPALGEWLESKVHIRSIVIGGPFIDFYALIVFDRKMELTSGNRRQWVVATVESI